MSYLEEFSSWHTDMFSNTTPVIVLSNFNVRVWDCSNITVSKFLKFLSFNDLDVNLMSSTCSRGHIPDSIITRNCYPYLISILCNLFSHQFFITFQITVSCILSATTLCSHLGLKFITFQHVLVLYTPSFFLYCLNFMFRHYNLLVLTPNSNVYVWFPYTNKQFLGYWLSVLQFNSVLSLSTQR